MRKVGIAALVLLLLGATLPSASAGDLINYIWDTRTYQHPYPTDIRPGDLVYGHSPDLFNAIIPGFWVHVAIVAWYNDTIDDWMVIEAKIGKGIIISPLREFLSRYDIVALQRVKTTDDVRQKAVEFAYQQLGKPYNYNYIGKPEVYDDKYYCSQLVWAAYLVASNYQINLDENDGGWSWKYFYSVAPQEVYDDPMTYTLYYDEA
ncbi:hypothetical membrane protein, conserved [Thermococcus kodakarensis KOD1]|uniref:Hypothetical membrane protein, conserved n=1 Tax=Thermococcus kodakarensis (strain ATCC BAA-918 / JCM 12380 / KOD1) TaxID=69014 RepID=Q5JET8_THEKO|nr:YiiX/YebB-like N1pC/P60 family cysteine hydrolase [Thermococcus kodakarensis]WCN27818.1 YiiX/YebB-like N1pC/P60 family cysteine hydrolase [Thermococcus kodakarensis]WCN30115.1 YiiX/YebB-like N1pC/P60 family cysteine hydrolase [Thermococcus kodakarensis]BAD86116.1 hypothetical membrane protein, conserved [Thermococcus kodakarensis KOD1]